MSHAPAFHHLPYYLIVCNHIIDIFNTLIVLALVCQRKAPNQLHLNNAADQALDAFRRGWRQLWATTWNAAPWKQSNCRRQTALIQTRFIVINVSSTVAFYTYLHIDIAAQPIEHSLPDDYG